MTSPERRLTALEGRMRPRTPAMDRQRACLRTLPTADLEILDAVPSVREEGSDESSIPAASLTRYVELLSDWQRFGDDHGPVTP